MEAKGTPARRNQNSSTPGNIQCAGQTRGSGERSRRAALRGRCFRCAKEDHMLPQCSYPATVKCNTCNGTGHISSACGKRQTANASNTHLSAPSASSLVPSMHQLAIGYDGPVHSSPPVSYADGASSNWGSQSASSHAGVFYTPSSRPTPEMPL